MVALPNRLDAAYIHRSFNENGNEGAAHDEYL